MKSQWIFWKSIIIRVKLCLNFSVHLKTNFYLWLTPFKIWFIIWTKIFPFFPNLIRTEYEYKQWNSARNIKSLISAFLLTIKQRIKRGSRNREHYQFFTSRHVKNGDFKHVQCVQSNSEFLSYAISKIGLTGTAAIHQAHGEAQCGGSI